MTDPEKLDKTEKTLDELIVYLKRVKADIEANIEVDLAGMEYSVANICEAIEKAPEDFQAKIEPKMKTMTKELEALAETLKNHPDITEESDTDY